MTPFPSSRLTRASTKRSRIWTMTPRFLTTIGAIGPRVAGGEIFSKLKAGMVYHLVVELRHSWKSPGHRSNDLACKPSDPVWCRCQNPSITCAKVRRIRPHCRALPVNLKCERNVRSAFPDIRGDRGRRGADRTARGVPRGAGAAETDGVRRSPRRSAAKRVCRALRGAAGLADRLYRLGRD